MVLAIGGGSIAGIKIINKSSGKGSVVTTDESSAIKAGKQLTDNHCEGSGTVPLSYGPMKPDQISIIEPYGLTVGGHVTPIDHQYYWAKNNTKDQNDVLALADGTMADIEFRQHSASDAARNGVAGDYRVVISYSCTFMSYFDLATSLTPDISAQLPKGWEKDGRTSINIPVKAGQVIAKMGGQSLDFAVWDMTKNNPKLLVPAAYDGEAWKIHTVNPLDYFADSVKTSLLPYYTRTVKPQDGEYAYDVAGKLVGTWFLKGSNGYAGNVTPGTSGYWSGHLVIAPDFIDPTVWGLSIGDFKGQATQFTVKPPLTDPNTIGVESGLVKLELLQVSRYLQSDGTDWDGLKTAVTPLKLPTNGNFQGTVLVQLTDADTLMLEIFPSKTANQVTVFDDQARVYDRGKATK